MQNRKILINWICCPMPEREQIGRRSLLQAARFLSADILRNTMWRKAVACMFSTETTEDNRKEGT